MPSICPQHSTLQAPPLGATQGSGTQHAWAPSPRGGRLDAEEEHWEPSGPAWPGDTSGQGTAGCAASAGTPRCHFLLDLRAVL